MAATSVGAPRTKIVSAFTPYLAKKPRSRATHKGATRAFIAAWAMTTVRPALAASEGLDGTRKLPTAITATIHHPITFPFIGARQPSRFISRTAFLLLPPSLQTQT